MCIQVGLFWSTRKMFLSLMTWNWGIPFRRLLLESIIAWYPHASVLCLSPSKLFEIYTNIGVQIIFASVKKDESPRLNVLKMKKIDLDDALIRKRLA